MLVFLRIFQFCLQRLEKVRQSPLDLEKKTIMAILRREEFGPKPFTLNRDINNDLRLLVCRLCALCLHLLCVSERHTTIFAQEVLATLYFRLPISGKIMDAICVTSGGRQGQAVGGLPRVLQCHVQEIYETDRIARRYSAFMSTYATV